MAKFINRSFAVLIMQRSLFSLFEILIISYNKTPSPNKHALIPINSEFSDSRANFSLKRAIIITPLLLPHFFSISIPLSLRVFFPLTVGFSIFSNFKIQFFATQVNLERSRKRSPRDECDVRAYRKWHECSSHFPVYLRQFVLHLQLPILVLSIASTKLRVRTRLRSLFAAVCNWQCTRRELSKICSRD